MAQGPIHVRQNPPVEVIIVLSGGQVHAVPDSARIAESAQNEIVWHVQIPGASAKIHFTGDCPFASKTFHAPFGGSVASGPALKDKHRLDPYRYNILVTLADGQTIGKDPEVIVDP